MIKLESESITGFNFFFSEPMLALKRVYFSTELLRSDRENCGKNINLKHENVHVRAIHPHVYNPLIIFNGHRYLISKIN